MVERYVERFGAVLIDTYKSANSRMPHWRGAVLAAQFGDRYAWWPELGK